MAASESNSERIAAGNGFRILPGPIPDLAAEEYSHAPDDNLPPPQFGSESQLFAIARDPHTIFTYWEIDWKSVFDKTPPLDRQVHIRVLEVDGSEQTSVTVEPMAGNCYVNLSEPQGPCRLEIGYYDAPEHWNCVAMSDVVTMPSDRVSEEMDVDLATIPFHLSFQKLIDQFRASSDKNALAEIMARLQGRAVSKAECASLTREEREMLQAAGLSLEEIEAGQREFLANRDESGRGKRASVILGLAGTSPTHGFGPSSWTSSGS